MKSDDADSVEVTDDDDPAAVISMRDARLAALINKVLDEAQSGGQVDIEQLAAANPEYADELRELWGIVEVAEDFGQPVPQYFDLINDNRFHPDRDKEWVDLIHSTPTFGGYELFEELGRGGMGVVYRARHISLDRIVALKIVLGASVAARADLARFRGEAETAARLNHPNIVPVYDVGEHEGLPYFTMRYIYGTTLAQRLADGPMQAREAAELLAPIARAIAHAHDHGVLHRDLKPSNILIDKEGQPYVSDFGLAKRLVDEPSGDADPTQLLRPITQTGAILGTPGFMSPEQAAGRRGVIGASTDVYSLGAILYAMITGRPPFQAASPVDTVMLVLEQDPVAPQVLNPSVDRDLEMIALKCLQKPVELRYESTAELASDLEAYLNDEPVSARSSRFAQILTRAFRETHHVGVLENWGLLWILHAAVLLTLCVVTNIFQLSGVVARWPYLALWTGGLSAWAVIFWNLRRRSGPITFVERQIAHVWAGSMIADTFMYIIEWQLGLAVLTLSPMLGPVSGAVFLMKAAMLSGKFYIYSVVLCLTGLVMAWLQRQTYIPNIGLTIFGIVSAACFFIPGWKYYRQIRRDR